jgi:hypothetical protein
MLWTEEDRDLWLMAQTVRCFGKTSPKVVRGEVIPGRRCKNTVVFPTAWLVVPELSPPPIILCWAHNGQRKALLEAVR